MAVHKSGVSVKDVAALAGVSVGTLRRWQRDLRARDLFGAPSATAAEQRLKHCAERLEDYTDRVFHHLHQA